MNRRTEPLSPEERDLAERLERLGGPREPAPALDAAILAAARAAVAPDTAAPADPDPPAQAPAAAPAEAPADPKVTPLRPRKKPAPPRWPLGFGLAASLVLAAGIGWKLQGDGEGSSAEIAEASAPAAMADEAMEAVMIDPPAAPPPPPPLESDTAAAQRFVPAPATAASKAAPVASEQLGEAEATASVRAFDAAPAAAAGPLAADSAEVAADNDAGLDKVTVTGARVPAGRNVGAAEHTRTPLSQRREQTMQISTQPAAAAPAPVSAPPPPPPPPPAAPAPAAPPAPERARAAAVAAERDAEARKSETAGRFDERPPVSADSPEFRQAWLQRIRERLARGEEQAARDSLQEFRRRYPDVELPEDLRKLAATLPPVP